MSPKTIEDPRDGMRDRGLQAPNLPSCKDIRFEPLRRLSLYSD